LNWDCKCNENFLFAAKFKTTAKKIQDPSF